MKTQVISIISLIFIFIGFQNFTSTENSVSEFNYSSYKNKKGQKIETWSHPDNPWKIESSPTNKKSKQAFRLHSKKNNYKSTQTVYAESINRVWVSKNILGSSFTLITKKGKIHKFNTPMDIQVAEMKNLKQVKRKPSSIGSSKKSSYNSSTTTHK